jgi:hypothetical protein
MPSSERATHQGESGQGDVLLDNTDSIDRAIAERFAAPPAVPPPDEPPPPSEPTPFSAHGGGCGISDGAGHDGAGLAWLAAVLMLGRRRRHP